MGKSRSRYDDDDETWEEKEEKFNNRRQKRNVRNVASAIDELIKKESDDGQAR